MSEAYWQAEFVRLNDEYIHVVSERDSARRERDHAMAERDELRGVRDRALMDHAALYAEVQRLRAFRDRVLAIVREGLDSCPGTRTFDLLGQIEDALDVPTADTEPRGPTTPPRLPCGHLRHEPISGEVLGQIDTDGLLGHWERCTAEPREGR